MVFSSGSQVSQGLHRTYLKKGAFVLQFFLLSLPIACEKPATVFVLFNSSRKTEARTGLAKLGECLQC
jgi:hypothetical protein